MTPRLTSAMLVSALVRRIGQAGGNATVLARGDADAGAVLLICAERGMLTAVLERILDAQGRYKWQQVGPQVTDNAQEINEYTDRRRARDGDLWVVELDIANAERFAAETIADA